MLRLYDTSAQAVVDVEPVRTRELSMQCCGPELSRPAHLGDLRTALLGDLVHRTADLDGLHVTMVRSLLDNADQGRRHEVAFHTDLAALGIRPAHTSARASGCDGPSVDLIARLVAGGHAYPRGDGSVLFDARSSAGYGALSGHRPDDVAAGTARGEVVQDRRSGADWTLWQPAGDSARPAKESPWGPGVPGAFVACSALATSRLGGSVDVHTGGSEQLFPHHENESAQSDAAAGHQVVRHWVHGAELLFEGRPVQTDGVQAVLLADVLARGHDPLALRLAFLRTRYRSRTDLCWADLAWADHRLDRWRYQVATWAEEPSRPIPPAVAAELVGCLLDDLDTPRVLAGLRRLELDTGVAAGAKFETFAFVDRVLGLELVRQVGRPVRPAKPAPPPGRAPAAGPAQQGPPGTERSA